MHGLVLYIFTDTLLWVPVSPTHLFWRPERLWPPWVLYQTPQPFSWSENQRRINELSTQLLESTMFVQFKWNPQTCSQLSEDIWAFQWIHYLSHSVTRANGDKSIFFSKVVAHLSLIRRLREDGSRGASSLEWTEGKLGQVGLWGNWFACAFACVYVFYMWCREGVWGE